MKLMHLSDLHLGRMLHRFSLQEEQTEVLERIRQVCKAEKPDAVLIAGDVYDRGVPPVYAIQMLDTFLQGLLAVGTQVFLISGNHDSAERLGFLSGALAASGLHVSPAYRGQVSPIVLEDEDGPVHVWLLPFVKAATVRPFFPEEEILTTHDAVSAAIRHMDIDARVRNVLVAHQFVAGARASGSEESLDYLQDINVGGSDLVAASVFAPFDYVALGHLHGAQHTGSERIRYCGTPMAYSYSEARQEKSVTIVHLGKHGALDVRTSPLAAPRQLQEVRGAYAALTSAEKLLSTDRDAYTHVTLTDDCAISNIMDGLRQVYPRLTHVDWDNARTRHAADASALVAVEKRTPLSLFAEFYERMGGAALDAEQEAYLAEVIREVWEEDACGL